MVVAVKECLHLEQLTCGWTINGYFGEGVATTQREELLVVVVGKWMMVLELCYSELHLPHTLALLPLSTLPCP